MNLRVGLCILGVSLLGLAVFFSEGRDWQVAAKATLAGLLGVTYLSVGIVALRTSSFDELLRWSVATLPVAYLLLRTLTALAQFLAVGELSLSAFTSLSVLCFTLLCFPAGLGYVYGRSSSRLQEQSVGAVAVGSLLIGALIAGVTWRELNPTSMLTRFMIVAFVGLIVVPICGLPPYLLARVEIRVESTTK
ncbi:hypothetical protein [Haladaptatus sp. ZSTT2]|uniref:hypothetical protein n=1 Tax=Haladaptatus sp. ZSTT2 TaxID=3120515 RepID=UPI00300EA671